MIVIVKKKMKKIQSAPKEKNLEKLSNKEFFKEIKKLQKDPDFVKSINDFIKKMSRLKPQGRFPEFRIHPKTGSSQFFTCVYVVVCFF